MYMIISYLKQVIRAAAGGKNIPSIVSLIRQFKLYVYYQRNTDVFQNAMPWVTFSAIEFLENYLKKDMKVFEFGGGGSTLFFARKTKELVTVEHDPEWFSALTDQMKSRTNVIWKSYLVVPEPSAAGKLDASNPTHYSSDGVQYSNKTFRAYASVIDQFPDDYFDLVVVDGRSRPSCIMHSLKKVKPGGLLLIDNADRQYYLKNVNQLLGNFSLVCSDFGPVPYYNFFSQSNIYQRIR
jgi:hypothetical protein